MIKTDALVMQELYQANEIEVSAERRRILARKGEVLYGKYCGTGGRGICAESFAEYHVWRGEYAVARDFLVFLAVQLDTLHQTSPSTDEIQAQLAMTERLIARIQALLGEEKEQTVAFD